MSESQAVRPQHQRSEEGPPADDGPVLMVWWRRVRAVFRLLRVLMLLLRMSVLMPVLFKRLDDAGRRARVAAWSREVLDCLGITLHVQGHARPGAKLLVSNHVSWLDIITINSVETSRFVSKVEVAQWPLVGPMVTLAGTIYLERARRRDAMRVVGLVTQTLRDGHVAAVFPEGTTGSGLQLLPFHGNLLQSAIDADVPAQAAALRYSDSRQAVSQAAAYVGDTSLLQSLWWIACAQDLSVTLMFQAAHRVTHTDRRALAELLRQDIDEALLAFDTQRSA
jgi:1-acyl-sn-glycerol-3-phosphate acyltransferase